MGMQIVVDYQEREVTYDVTTQEKDIYQLCLSTCTPGSGTYIPSKINIRRKGKLWISDLETAYRELVSALLSEITRFSTSE
ncbi:MAG: hypothetical protein EOO12_05145 [Chitinophagaceae bacterium]|nr:MAG: hypothetical protein EOO12_05145 [Chitinophagaceae bacterium]